jgi:TorA maturation chaperone TorD
MRDAGLEEAIRAAGGVGALAQRIGISQPSVSNWSRVPAERIAVVEAVTGVTRAVLRPDLFGEASAAAIAEAAAATSADRASREFFDLFIGIGGGEMMPYGSYYLTGFLHERPLARLREDLGPLGIERADGNPEPEDHAAVLCEIMAGIVGGQFPAPAGSDKALFDAHLAPWIGRFFADLERAAAADLYRRVGALGSLFIAIESEAFTLPS